MRLIRLISTASLALALTGCFGGGKVPPVLMTLAPQAAATANMTRSAGAGETVTIDDPVTPKSLKSLRVPAEVGDISIAYIKNAQWIDTPDHLFRQLVDETVKRTTNRVVLNPRQSTLDPGLRVSGTLDRFDYDASAGAVVVRYDAALSATTGSRVETRRFEAREPSAGTKDDVGPALNRAANRVASEVAQWIGNHG